MYFLCSENEGADQLHGYREADLCLCFHICKKLVFSRRSSDDSNEIPQDTLYEQLPVTRMIFSSLPNIR